ncbi:glycosyltransferase family 1 protein [Hebeloma cylindrosporum]|uniref:Glycosyltransferase family 1 protein n=1 Tax=Hebeloma cylindrosporum TaxID=76867 RepID=A0A0C3CU26_HEBCY|nr:glycosyltransferase family 1 protein [Hebeloma cylindrosporum h7]
MPSSAATDSHLLLVPLPVFGHIRPACILAARLVLERDNVVVTFFAPPRDLEQVRKDITNQFPESLIAPGVKENALKRIRIVTTFKSTDDNIVNVFIPFFQSYPVAYETLYHGKPFTCATTGEVFDALPPPVAVVLDLCSFAQFHATRALSGTSVPIVLFLPATASYFVRGFGPESLGGIGDFGKRVDEEAVRLGVSPDEIGDKLPFDAPIAPIIRGGIQILNECDAVLIATSHSYEEASLIQVKSWFKSLPQDPPLYAIGPLLPPGYGRRSVESPESKTNQVERDLQAFLKEMQSKYGERSVVFISFGTNCWPTVPEYVDEVVQALIEKKVPFILCHASPLAKILEETANKVKSSGLGFITTWAPQQYVFNHPATGWFLTHGGNGGVTEALGCGIPMICWPFNADQPTTSAHLSCTLKVAFELVEVRTGPDGLKPMQRNGLAPKGTREAVGKEIREVLEACRSERADELRRNAQEMKRKFENAWEDDGEAKRDLNAFLARYA